MSKNNKEMSCLAKYIACGMIIGSALGTGAAVLIKTTKKPEKSCKSCSCKSTADMLRNKAANAMDTVGTIMQNLADFTR